MTVPAIPPPPPPPLARQANYPPSLGYPSGQWPQTHPLYVSTRPHRPSVVRRVLRFAWIIFKVMAWTFAIVFVMNLVFGILGGGRRRRFPY